MYFMHCKRTLQLAENIFFVDSAKMLLFCDLLCCLGFTKKQLKHCIVHYCPKNRRFCGIRSSLGTPQTNIYSVHIIGSRNFSRGGGRGIFKKIENFADLFS